MIPIYLVRHGQTEWSLSGQHTGRIDIPLTPIGEEEARVCGRRLEKMEFANVWTSPLQRARRTCELAGFAAQAHLEPDLMEWNYGDYEGLLIEEIRKKRPDWNVFEHGCPGGESPEQVSARADRVIALLRGIQGKTIIFSHGHFLRSLAVRFLGLPIQMGQSFALGTGAISILGYKQTPQERSTMVLWNSGPTLPR